MSNSALVESAAVAYDDSFAALADARHRTVVRLVAERSPAEIGKDELALQLAGVISDDGLAAVADEDKQRALVELHHQVLPHLTDAGLLEETDGSVRTADHWLLEEGKFDDLVSAHRSFDADELDAVFTALADERRRTTLAALSERDAPIGTEALAHKVAARETETIEGEVPQGHVDEVLASLVHVHLPLLHDATLVGYAVETDHVSYEGHPAVRAEWIQSTDDVSMADRTVTTIAEKSSQFRL